MEVSNQIIGVLDASWQSNANGGIKRTIEIYDVDGELIKQALI